MGWKKWVQRLESLFSHPILREPFYVFTLTILTLLLPLSFLLLGRLSTLQYLSTLTTSPALPSSLLFSLFFYTNPAVLHSLVSFVSVTALLYGLTGRATLLNELPKHPVLQPRLYGAWIFLCTLQICVGLGMEATIAAGTWPANFRVVEVRTLISRLVFVVGLHETMLHWCRMVVRPVVDDTVFGVPRKERWVERVVMASSFGTLWWWRLRDETEVLVVMLEVKRELSIDVRVADFVGWWLYYLIATIGVVRLLKLVFWLGKLLLCRGVDVIPGGSDGDDDKV